MNNAHFRRLLMLTLVVSGLGAGPVFASTDSATFIIAGDKAWAQRAQGHQDSIAAAEPIQNAIEAYTASLDADPENLEARWKLLRAFHFKGEFVLSDRRERHELFKQGRDIAEAGRLQIESQYGLSRSLFKMEPVDVVNAVGGSSAIAEWCFWSAANWGLWGQYSGNLASLFAGLVYKIRQFSEIMVLLDESVENGGGYRLRGRFHFRVPKIPLITGWVDKDQAISDIQRSLEVAPHNILSQLYLAEALLKLRRSQKQEAIGILQKVVASKPDPDQLVENIKASEIARELLARTGD